VVKPASEKIKYNELYIVNYSVTVQPWQQCCNNKHTREIGPWVPACDRCFFHRGGSHLSSICVSHPRTKDMSCIAL